MDISSITLNKTLIKWIVGAAAVIVVLAIFLGGYGGLNAVLNVFSNPRQEVSAPLGTLFLSLGTLSTSTGLSNGIHPVIVSASDNKMVYFPTEDLSGGRTMVMQHSFSENGNLVTFLGATYSQDSGVEASFNVYKADLSNTSSYEDMAMALKHASSVTSTTDKDYFRESPVISTKGEILYSSISRESLEGSKGPELLPASSWNIVMIDVKDEKRVVTQGLRPKWLDDTHFAYLGDDGIYLYDLGTETTQRVWKEDNGPLTLVQYLDISEDGRLIAFSDPVQGEVTIIRALDWSSNLVSLMSKISVFASNVVFSPDGKYLVAIVSKPSVETGGDALPTLRYYSLETQEFLPIGLPFDPSSIESIYITDWR